MTLPDEMSAEQFRLLLNKGIIVPDKKGKRFRIINTIPEFNEKIVKPIFSNNPPKSYFTFKETVEEMFDVVVVPEYRFHPKRKWRFDYAIPELSIAIEIEGGVWTNGRHTRGNGFLGDMEKYNEAVKLGWKLIRTTPHDLMHNAILNLKEIINEQKSNSHLISHSLIPYGNKPVKDRNIKNRNQTGRN